MAPLCLSKSLGMQVAPFFFHSLLIIRSLSLILTKTCFILLKACSTPSESSWSMQQEHFKLCQREGIPQEFQNGSLSRYLCISSSLYVVCYQTTELTCILWLLRQIYQSQASHFIMKMMGENTQWASPRHRNTACNLSCWTSPSPYAPRCSKWQKTHHADSEELLIPNF